MSWQCQDTRAGKQREPDPAGLPRAAHVLYPSSAGPALPRRGAGGGAAQGTRTGSVKVARRCWVSAPMVFAPAGVLPASGMMSPAP